LFLAEALFSITMLLMCSTDRYDIKFISPENHPGFTSDSIFARINNNKPPLSLPLFHRHRSSIESRLKITPDLVKHLIEYNAGINNVLSDTTKSRLRNTTNVVIAGQQPGLLLGPVYTFWKLLTTVIMARDISKQDRTDTLPLFWIASEDHDIFEVNRVLLNGSKFVAKPEISPVHGQMPPVGLISLINQGDRLLKYLSVNLPEKPYKSWLIELVSECDFTSYSRMFATLAAALFKDWQIVFVDALEIRKWTAPHLADIVSRFDSVQSALNGFRANLTEAGFQPALNDPGVFEILQGDVPARVKCQLQNGVMNYSDGKLSYEDAAELIRLHPERFSTGAALRPVVQDCIFPVSAMVCGPSEMLYLWQIDGIYKELGWRRSMLHPRVSATIIGNRTRQLINKIGSIEEAFLLDNNVDFSTEDIDHISDLCDEICHAIRNIEDSDPKLTAKAVSSIQHQVGKLTANTIKRRQEKTGSRQNKQKQFREVVLPNGKPQERVIGLFDILVEWGPDWLEWMKDDISPWQTNHQIVIMKNEKR